MEIKMYPKFELRYLRIENSEEPDKLQYRTVYDENITIITATNWQDIPVHIKQNDGTVIDQGSNKLVY